MTQTTLIPRGPFPVEPGDTVRYVDDGPRSGFRAGYFIEWRRGPAGLEAVLGVPPHGRHHRVPVERLRESRDQRTQRLRAEREAGA